MVELRADALVLDVEGTTSSIAFVHDVLFPFAARELEGFLAQRWAEASVQSALADVAQDAGWPSGWAASLDERSQRGQLLAELRAQMARDAKATGLKRLQGMIWELGYASGELRSHVYPDVPPALRAWATAGLPVHIYSSGSVAAQKLFFAHTELGDLRPLLSGHFDTTLGPKREAASYARLCQALSHPPHRVAFVTDVLAEADAAQLAGVQAVLSIRPGNAPLPADLAYPSVTGFDQLSVVRLEEL